MITDYDWDNFDQQSYILADHYMVIKYNDPLDGLAWWSNMMGSIRDVGKC